MTWSTKPLGRRFLVAAVGLVLLLAWVGTDTAAAQEVSKKLERQIAHMEDIISDVLIESPNLLVSSGGPTFGIYVDGFGVILNLETSLVSSNHWRDGISFLRGIGRGRIVLYDDDDDYWDDEDWDDEDPDDEDDEAYKRWRDRRKARSERRYDRGIQELREALLESGDILDELADDEYVAIAVFLEDHRYFRRHRISRAFMKVKMSDLRAHADGRISYEELASRLVENVY